MHMLQGRCDFRTALFRRFRPHILSQFIPLRLSLRRTYPFQHSTARFFRAPRLAPAPRARASHPRPAPAPAPRAPRLRPHPRPAPHACACAPRPATAPNFHKPPPQCLVSIVKAQEAGPISPRFRKRFVLCAKKLTPAYRLKRACIAPLFSCAPDALHAFPALLMNQNAGCPCAEALRV